MALLTYMPIVVLFAAVGSIGITESEETRFIFSPFPVLRTLLEICGNLGCKDNG